MEISKTPFINSDEPFDEILGEPSEEDYKNIQNQINYGSQTIHPSGSCMTIADRIEMIKRYKDNNNY